MNVCGERLGWQVVRFPTGFSHTDQSGEPEKRKLLVQLLRMVENHVTYGEWNELYGVDIHWRDIPGDPPRGEWWAMLYGDPK